MSFLFYPYGSKITSNKKEIAQPDTLLDHHLIIYRANNELLITNY